jgi:protein TonB
VATAGGVVPPTCVKCAIPDAVRVLQERRGLSPNVRIRVYVSEMGSVLRVEYLAGAPMLRDAITKAALGWRYQPARRGDTPVAAVVEVDVKF